jgi:hypothetical protein
MFLTKPMFPIIIVLCLSIAFLFMRTKQLQREIDNLSFTNVLREGIAQCVGDDESCPLRNVVEPAQAPDAERDAPAPEGDAPEDPEIEVIRCELREQGTTCKGSAKELKKKLKEKKIS